MLEIIGIFTALAIIVALTIRRVPLSYTMLAGSALLALFFQRSLSQVGEALRKTLLDRSTVELILAVVLIGVLGKVMGELGQTGRMVDALSSLLGNPRLAIAAAPALIGLLPVFGGAFLSAPMVNRLGNQLGLSPERRAAINLVFRHALHFAWPLVPSMIITSQLAGVTVPEIVAYQLPLSLAIVIWGYLVLLRGGSPAHPTPARRGWLPSSGKAPGLLSYPDSAAGDEADAVVLPETSSSLGQVRSDALNGNLSSPTVLAAPHRTPGEPGAGGREKVATQVRSAPTGRVWALQEFLLSSLPLLVSLLLALAVKLPLYLALLAGVTLAIYQGRARGGVLRLAWSGVDLNLAVGVYGIMLLREIMGQPLALLHLVEKMVAAGVPLVIVLLGIPGLLGLATAAQTATVGITIPLLLPLALAAGGDRLASAVLIYISSYMSYFISPLHLCQALTLEYFGSRLGGLYREYLLLGPAMMLVALLLYYLHQGFVL